MLESYVKYFKENKAYQRVFTEMRSKWRSYGRVSGFIELENANAAEREALQLFLGRSFDSEAVKFRMSEFEKALQETKFKEIGMQELLEGYFHEKLITNKDENRERKEAKQTFFEVIIRELIKEKSRHKDTIRWLEQAALQKKYGYSLITSEYEKQEDAIKAIIMQVCRAVSYIQFMSENKIRLAVLSAEITSNPHFFDKGSVAGKLLIYALSFINNCEYPSNAEGILELYYLSNIKPDDISSFTTAYGVSLYTEEGAHPSYEAFIRGNEPYLITLLNLNKIIKADCRSKQVFIFENQMVFSHMCESLAGMPVSMICTSGQMKTASLMLIDLLCKSDCRLYYSGDIDPEGIKIADKVIARDPVHIIPWRLSRRDYELSISNENLDASRIKKLDRVQDSRFMEIIEALRNRKRAGYQELLIDLMLYDIKEKMTGI